MRKGKFKKRGGGQIFKRFLNRAQSLVKEQFGVEARKRATFSAKRMSHAMEG